MQTKNINFIVLECGPLYHHRVASGYAYMSIPYNIGSIFMILQNHDNVFFDCLCSDGTIKTLHQDQFSDEELLFL